jgi:hypothetical protein
MYSVLDPLGYIWLVWIEDFFSEKGFWTQFSLPAHLLFPALLYVFDLDWTLSITDIL